MAAPRRAVTARAGMQLLAAAMTAVALAALTQGAYAGDTAAGTLVPDRTVIGLIGNERITAADVAARDPASFARLQTAHTQQLHVVELQYAQARHDLLQRDLESELDRRALQREAAARRSTPDALLATVSVAPVTDADVRAFYEARKSLTDQSFEQLAVAIRQYLENEHRESAQRPFYQALRARYGVTSTLEPFRVSVAPAGPARGAANAAVTIVEFGDYQCPYCRREEPVLQALLSHHPHDVRLVFRNLPLSDIHADAAGAARAAACADRQGKFWEMHDALYQDQSALGAAALAATAARLGLDGPRFAACLADAAQTAPALEADAAAAAELGVNSTPYFFVDGRPLRGTVSAEQFEQFVSEELAHAPRAQR